MTDEQYNDLCARLDRLTALVERSLQPRPEQPKTKRGRREPSPRWMTIKEVADMFCVSEGTVSRGMTHGTWPFSFLRRVQVGGRVLISRPSVEKMHRVLDRAAVTFEGER